MTRFIALALLPLGACVGETPDPGTGTGNVDPTCEGSDCKYEPVAKIGVEMDVRANYRVDDVGVGVCVDTHTCVLTLTPGSHVISATAEGFVVLDKTVEVNDDASEVTFEGEVIDRLAWDQFGDCGFDFGTESAPSLFCDKDGDTRELYTEIREDRGVAVRGLIFDSLPMLGYAFEFEMDGYVDRGLYDIDAGVIHYEYWLDGEKYDEEVITLGACGS